jgi:hypothetical protein
MSEGLGWPGLWKMLLLFILVEVVVGGVWMGTRARKLRNPWTSLPNVGRRPNTSSMDRR